MLLPRFLTSLALLGSCSLASAAVVENMRSFLSPEYTRLVFDLDGVLDHRVFTLDDPQRLVIDLLDSELRGPLAETELAGTPIAGIRSAPRNGKDIRVVLDLHYKVQARSFLIPRNDEAGDRLVIDLYGSESGTRLADNQPIPIATAIETAVANHNRDIVVAISAGHGGADPGAIGVNRIMEKHVVLAISREVAERINATPGFRAVIIRDGDYYIGLRERTKLAYQSKADLYIAIHADAHTNSSAQGSTIYALSRHGATSEQAQRLADKENSADLIGGVGSVSLSDKDEVLASVLIDLSMTATVATSLEIGDRLIGSLGDVIRMRRKNVEQAAFVELKQADIPSLLIEAGYITNPNDAKNLDSPVWRKRFAGALAEGITEWFHERPPRGSWVAWHKENGGLAPSTYTVKRGDTLSQIAERQHVSLALLKSANNLSSNTIRVGQILKLPGTGTTPAPVIREHKISRGETLSQIAMAYAVPLSVLREANQLKGDKIRVGQVLKIPTT